MLKKLQRMLLKLPQKKSKNSRSKGQFISNEMLIKLKASKGRQQKKYILKAKQKHEKKYIHPQKKDRK